MRPQASRENKGRKMVGKMLVDSNAQTPWHAVRTGMNACSDRRLFEFADLFPEIVPMIKNSTLSLQNLKKYTGF